MREQSVAEIVASSAEERKHLYDVFNTPERLDFLKNHWPFFARPSQLPPPGGWSNWLILAGRGFGKTRTGAEWVRANMCGSSPLMAGRWRHIALVAETSADARAVVVGDGKAVSDPTAGSGILQVHPKDFRPAYEPSKRRLTWPNGAIATIYNGTEPDQLRGPQHDAAWCDELAKWQYAQQAWEQLQFGLRTGDNPQVCITTTPRPIALLKELMKDPGTVVTRGSTFDNSGNFSEKFLASIRRKYEGTRLGRQELNAELLEDIEGALWKRSLDDALRVRVQDLPPLKRIVVAIDPNASSEEDSNECGIICAGLGIDGHGYVLDDVSGVMAPHEWAMTAISLLHERMGDRIIAETNNGGEMVEHTLRMVDPSIPFSAVWASRGKVTRTEPISALYEQGARAPRRRFPAPGRPDVRLHRRLQPHGNGLFARPRGRACLGSDRIDD
jgi:phage terminase large subunit-like protein